MVILVTGSAGHLGEGLMRHLRQQQQQQQNNPKGETTQPQEQAVAVDVVLGLDILPSPYTDIVGSIVDPATCRAVIRENNVTAILHTAALHKPHVATHSQQEFVNVNITGTLNLLQAAVEAGTVQAFIFTSTTSTFGHALVHHDDNNNNKNNNNDTKDRTKTATWIDETVVPIPKNIYGVTKCAAEDLCQLYWQLHGLPSCVLKVARFFPEDDDTASIRDYCSTANAKVNELLHRRADLYDMCTAHVAALQRAPQLGFEKFIITSTTPFTRNDVTLVAQNAPQACRQCFPQTFDAVYHKLQWKMFATLDRIYDNAKARRLLQWEPRYTFQNALQQACDWQSQQQEQQEQEFQFGSELARQVGKKYYHRRRAKDDSFDNKRRE